MKKGTMAGVTVAILAAFLAGGCANKDIIKSEEPVVKAAAPLKTPEPVKQQVMTEPVKAAGPIEQAGIQPTQSVVTEPVFENVYFNFAKSDLLQDARNTLNKNAEILLKENPSIKIQISGNCDERGSAEYNLALGERRAKSAQQYLITLGVPTDRLSTISYGKEKPAVEGHDEAAWAKNRRDDFVLLN